MTKTQGATVSFVQIAHGPDGKLAGLTADGNVYVFRESPYGGSAWYSLSMFDGRIRDEARSAAYKAAQERDEEERRRQFAEEFAEKG